MVNSHAEVDGVIGDFCDGSNYKSSPLFCSDPCALQLQLYYDELKICNPLGSKAKKRKVGKVSFFKSLSLQKFCFRFGILYTG